MTAIIETTEIGPDTQVGEFSIIRAGARIGRGVIIHPHVIIESGVEIGDYVEIFPFTHIGKPPKGAGALARSPEYEPRVTIGESSTLGPRATIFYDVTIGAHTLIGDGASIREQCVVGDRCIISRCVTLNYAVVIGDRTKVMDLTHLTGNMTIGDDVFISCGVLSANDNALGQQGYGEAHVQGPTIGDGALIGMGAKLLPHVRIGARAVVGSGALVTRDVGEGVTVMGIPARPR